MTYKTIALRLLEANQELYEQLRTSGMLLQTLEHYAAELKTMHDSWKDELRQAQPGTDPQQMSSAALELALQDLQASLPAASSPSATQDEGLSLDDAIRFLRRHTPPG
jgi:hypothetical protein